MNVLIYLIFMISLVFETYHQTFQGQINYKEDDDQRKVYLFGLIFTVLFKAAPIDEYEGVDAFAYYLMIFRIAAGDFSTDNYKDQSQYLVILTWIVWIVAVISLNVVFMNFIIAVISESYEKVMQKIVAESYKVKVQMIKERELFFREWQGFIKDIKQTVRTSTTKSKIELMQNLVLLQNSINENRNYQEKKNEEIKERIEGLEKFMRESMNKLLENSGQKQQENQ
ncbi:UNKNOWN [Stylonychia lemnae]|uniref:Ion transport domain-containing protein n=1 Tax=Stylonychia lemnae TaxID=5949 RepID=A0A078B4L0_STYLE|nr:UNKNOWN [Stylonychia lemnae]|eukprot:CDW88438.1 UNKNOWN [Stylonychia lemnae]